MSHATPQPATRATELPDYDAIRIALGWPTPEHMRRVADALDALTPARYGDVLRWFADRCDEWVWHMGDERANQRMDAVLARLTEGSAP